jgi:hypothetical protein
MLRAWEVRNACMFSLEYVKTICFYDAFNTIFPPMHVSILISSPDYNFECIS